MTRLIVIIALGSAPPPLIPEAILEAVAMEAVTKQTPKPASRKSVPESYLQEIATRRFDRVGIVAGRLA